MQIELKKESIKVSETIGQKYSEAMVETDIIVPDVKPDIERILQVDAVATLTNKDVQSDRVVIYGNVALKILYLPEKSEDALKVRSINASVSFSDIIDVKNAQPGMSEMTTCDVVMVEFGLINGRKLNAKCVVGIESKVYDDKFLELVTDIDSESNIQVKKNSVEVSILSAMAQKTFRVADEIEVPAGKPSIGEILKIDAKITGRDIKVVNNKVVLKGDLNYHTLYISDSGEEGILFMENIIPFTEIMDVEGIDADAKCDLYFEAGDVSFNVLEDMDGDQRLMSVDTGVEVVVRATVNVDLDTIFDCYGTSQGIDVKTKDIVLEVIEEKITSQALQKDMIEIPYEMPGIRQVYDVISKAYIESITPGMKQIEIKGVLDTYILYLTDDPNLPINSYKKETPFEKVIECQKANSNSICDIAIDSDGCSYSISGNKDIEVRSNLSIRGKVIKKQTISLIDAIEEQGAQTAKKNQSSIVVYFVQKGDELWDIAKHYSTTMDEILKVNELDGSVKLTKGQQLIIPKFN